MSSALRLSIILVLLLAFMVAVNIVENLQLVIF